MVAQALMIVGPRWRDCRIEMIGPVECISPRWRECKLILIAGAVAQAYYDTFQPQLAKIWNSWLGWSRLLTVVGIWPQMAKIEMSFDRLVIKCCWLCKLNWLKLEFQCCLASYRMAVWREFELLLASWHR